MSSTTIRLTDPFLKELKKIIPRSKSISAWIRLLLEREIRRYRMVKSASAYQRFLKDNPEEASEMDAWTNAPLAKEPPSRSRR